MKSMSKWLAASLAALILVAAPAVAQTPYYFWWQAVDENGLPYNSNFQGAGDLQCSVYRTNVHGAALLHTNASLSNAGNKLPLFNDSNGRFHFYSSSADPVDVNCYYRYGGAAMVAKFSRFNHKIVVPRGVTDRISRFTVNTLTSLYQQDSGVHIPSGALIKDIIFQDAVLDTASSQSHINIGFLGNHAIAGLSNSLVSEHPMNSGVEWTRPGLVGGNLDLGAGQFFYSGTHRGALLQLIHSYYTNQPGGLTRVTLVQDRRFLVHQATGLTIAWSAAPGGKDNDGSLTAIVAHVYVLWQQFHSGANRAPQFLP